MNNIPFQQTFTFYLRRRNSNPMWWNIFFNKIRMIIIIIIIIICIYYDISEWVAFLMIKRCICRLIIIRSHLLYICLIGLYIRYEWLDVDRQCILSISINLFHLMHCNVYALYHQISIHLSIHFFLISISHLWISGAELPSYQRMNNLYLRGKLEYQKNKPSSTYIGYYSW